MLVILKENVEKLGRIGDIIKVSDGYARNFLLPQGLVAFANEKNVEELKHHKRILAKKSQAQVGEAEKLVKKLEEFSCTISRKIGTKDKLYGSVGVTDIAAELKTAGFDIQKHSIQLQDNIKTLGVHPVTIKLLPEVTATLKVWVVKEE